jgi:hypothetical protein
MLYKLGRVLQIIGMILLPVGIAGQIARPDEVSVGKMLLICTAGMAIFALGWWLQRWGRPR